MRVSLAVRDLPSRREFRIARGRRGAVRNVFIRLEQDGICGYGEASPNAFYNETAEAVLEKLGAGSKRISELEIRSVRDISRVWTELWADLQPSRAAQCALDIALWDWLAKREGVSVAELAWGEPPQPVTSFVTIGISSPEELPDKIAEVADFPMIKIKSDAKADLGVVELVREKLPDALIAVDANCAWGEQSLERISAELAKLGVAFIEQPLPPDRDETLNASSSSLPVIADESCVTEADVDSAAARFSGFNIKLVKCGGITPGVRMARRGIELGSTMMVGCMLESSTLISAGAVVAQRTQYADLDGAWLLSEDPFSGLALVRGVLSPSGPGLGVHPTEALFEGQTTCNDPVLP